MPLPAIRAVQDAQRVCIGALRFLHFQDSLFRSFLGGFELDCEVLQACNTVVVFGFQSERSMRVSMAIVTPING
jgi:hypothetical protein